jgi:hypothetical protein
MSTDFHIEATEERAMTKKEFACRKLAVVSCFTVRIRLAELLRSERFLVPALSAGSLLSVAFKQWQLHYCTFTFGILALMEMARGMYTKMNHSFIAFIAFF